jgi:formamidopyrimidine-DNA glycosylase
VPELPEVETIRRQLAPLVEGRRIERVEVRDPRWSRPLAPAELEDALAGRRIETLARRGKYLLWNLEGDVHLAQHLRMTGSVLAGVGGGPVEPAHTRVWIELGGRSRGGRRESPVRLAVTDPRRFGTGELLLGEQALTLFLDARLGLEPFDEGFDADYLRTAMKGRTAPIKAMLLDQRRLAGVGNIYADEALFMARVHPQRPAGRLSREQYAALCEGVVAALEAGIDARGASIDDFRHIDGVRGSFQERFLVHLRAGEPCVRCATTIRKIVVAGRGTYVCERCQPRPRLRRPAARPGARPGRPRAAR